MTETVRCPDPECTALAEVVDRWTWNSTDGPIEHVRTRCLARHIFTPPAAMLIVDPDPVELSRSR